MADENIDLKSMRLGKPVPGWTPPGKRKAKKTTKKKTKK